MDPKSLTRDFKEFLRLLNDHRVEYLVRIEIQTGIDGVRFTDCHPRGIAADLDGVRVHFISLSDLKTNKPASGRNKDLADLDQLP